MPSIQDIFVFAIVLAAPWCVMWLWRRDVVRPGSLVRLAAAGRMRNPAPIGPGAWLMASVATYAAAVVGAGLAGAALGIRPGTDAPIDPGLTALVNIATYAAAAVVGVLCAAMLARGGRNLGTDARTLGLEARAGDVWAGLGGLPVIMPICIAAGVTVSLIAKALHQEAPRLGHTGLSSMVENRHTWHAWVKAFMAIIGAPVMEELVYRVFLQSAIISALARLRWARSVGLEGASDRPIASASDVFWGIVVSTIGFVLPHAGMLGGPAHWNALPSLAILGAWLGIVYERTRSPLAVMAIHAGFNAANVAVAMLTAGGTTAAAAG